MSYSPSVALTIAEALQSVVDSCEQPEGCSVSTGSAIDIENIARVEPALALAWSPWRPLGITTNVTYVRLDGNGDTGTSNGVKLGGAVEFDLGPAVGVPVGLQAVVAWTAPVGESSFQHVTDAGVGLYYTGRQELSVGVQVVGRRYAIEPEFVETEWSTYFTTFGLRYFW